MIWTEMVSVLITVIIPEIPNRMSECFFKCYWYVERTDTTRTAVQKASTNEYPGELSHDKVSFSVTRRDIKWRRV